tara:strand:- start:1743 stop:2057 length:315 start_codon:yes stop_codon:yes gene_type:complete
MNVPLLSSEKSTNICVPKYHGWHEIHIASYEGNYNEVLKLLKNDAFVSPVDVFGKTPLHYARRRKYGKKNDRVAELLIKYGADDNNEIDKLGRSPYDIYLRYNK